MNLERAKAASRRAIEKYHYTDLCSVVERRDVKDTKTKLTKQNEVTVFEGVPCKLSFETIRNAAESDTATGVSQNIKLFVSPDIIIPAGSKIIVEHEGRTGEYAQSGEAAVYFSHQEIMLTLFEGWA